MLYHFVFVRHPNDTDEGEYIKVASSLELYGSLHGKGGPEKSSASGDAIDHFGPELISQRLRAVILDERYHVPGCLVHAVDLFCAFSGSRAVCLQSMKCGTHVALVERAWRELRPYGPREDPVIAEMCLWGVGR